MSIRRKNLDDKEAKESLDFTFPNKAEDAHLVFFTQGLNAPPDKQAALLAQIFTGGQISEKLRQLQTSLDIALYPPDEDRSHAYLPKYAGNEVKLRQKIIQRDCNSRRGTSCIS